MDMYFQGNKKKHTKTELNLFEEYAKLFETSKVPTITKLQNFPKYIRRQDISRFLAKYEIFKKQLNIPGVIIECGTYVGGGAMTFAQLSSIMEPYNHTRKIICFDSFDGFPSVSEKDAVRGGFKVGDLKVYNDIDLEIRNCISLYDKNRPLSHIEKVKLIKGDACKTIPNFVSNNPHLIVSMLYLDFDIYDPTKIAIENIIPRMTKGSLIVFDELNAETCPGETSALIETLDIKKLHFKKTTFDPYISYSVIE